jgi:hypothetical protein
MTYNNNCAEQKIDALASQLYSVLSKGDPDLCWMSGISYTPAFKGVNGAKDQKAYWQMQVGFNDDREVIRARRIEEVYSEALTFFEPRVTWVTSATWSVV